MNKIFYAHNNENERDSKIVTRSSAIFYFQISESLNTELHYLNYWLIKRGVSDVKRKLTLRDMAGTTLLIQDDDVNTTGAQKIDISELTKSNNIKVECGSIEVEFHSANNMFIAYPALVVRYIGENWHTVAHSSQRILASSSGDGTNIKPGLSCEGNVSIPAGKGIRPFFIIHNGPKTLPPQKIAISVTSSTGQTLQFSTDEIASKPYETKIIYLDQYANVTQFLSGQFGTFVIEFNSHGVFPRLIAGCEKNGQWSIDHTNFADTQGPASLDVIPTNPQDPDKSLVFSFPRNTLKNWLTYADIYPTFPANEIYKLQVSTNSQDRSNSIRSETLQHKTVGAFNRVTIPSNDLDDHQAVQLSIHNEHQVPRRFHMGLHYQIGDGLPGFLTDGPLPYTTPGISTRWLPIFDVDNCENFILMAHRIIDDNDNMDVEFDIELYNSHGTPSLSSNIVLKRNCQICHSIEEIFPDVSDYLMGGPGWLYLVSSQKQRSVIHYASQYGDNSIAVCHAF